MLCLYFNLNYFLINSDKNQNIIDYLTQNIPATKGAVLSALKNKDILVNNTRIKENIDIFCGDKINIFIEENKIKKYFSIIYEDDNIVVVDKEKGIEVCDGENNLINYLKKDYKNIFAVHRIDRNTDGLVIFALNEKAKNSLENAIKQNKVDKFYLAEVVGVLKNNKAEMVAYLKKDSKKSLVKVFGSKVDGSSLIKTAYEVVERKAKTTIVKVQLFTGKTHQIRAHFAFIGFPLVGDGKYGDYEFNKKVKESSQKLTAYKLAFKFDRGDILEYLNNLQFEIKPKW